MSSAAQIAANTANAQHSSGPKTAEGKAVASQNRRKYGLTGRFQVLPWEDQEDFDALVELLRCEHQPNIGFESELIETMAQHYWLSQRAGLLQERCFDREVPDCLDEKQLALYMRYQTTHERAFERCANELRKLRNETRKAQIGFESQKRREADDARQAAHEIRRQAAENRKQELHQFAALLAQAKIDHENMLTSRVKLGMTLDAGRENRELAREQAA
jgi:hypothetical protein